MFYTTEDGHPLPHNPFKAIVSPRPIAWISTRDAAGRDNLAPYSFFNAVSDTPPQVVFSSTSAKEDRGDTKDTVANIRDTGAFCVNIVSYALRDAMNRSSGAWGRDVDEFLDAGIEKAPCETISCARVAAAPAALECKLLSITQLKGKNSFMVLGEVTGTYLADDCVVDGRFDVTQYEPLARLGYRDYARVSEVISLKRPND